MNEQVSQQWRVAAASTAAAEGLWAGPQLPAHTKHKLDGIDVSSVLLAAKVINVALQAPANH